MQNTNGEPLPAELRNVVDEYDRDHNAEILPQYEELFAVLRELHVVHPNWRFGQMVVNLAAMSGTTEAGEAYHVPDERLLKTAREHLASQRYAHEEDAT
jgi:hypothetical protein